MMQFESDPNSAPNDDAATLTGQTRIRRTKRPHATLVQGFDNGLYLDDAKVTGAARVKMMWFGLAVGVRR